MYNALNYPYIVIRILWYAIYNKQKHIRVSGI